MTCIKCATVHSFGVRVAGKQRVRISQAARLGHESKSSRRNSTNSSICERIFTVFSIDTLDIRREKHFRLAAKMKNYISFFFHSLVCSLGADSMNTFCHKLDKMKTNWPEQAERHRQSHENWTQWHFTFCFSYVGRETGIRTENRDIE